MIRQKMLLMAAAMLVCWCGVQALYAQNHADTIGGKHLRQEIAALMEKGDIPGLSVIVVQGGHLAISSFGYADVSRRTPVTPQTLFELGSCSKAFTAMAITALEQQGKLNLDDEITKYLPWFHATYEGEATNITLRHLLHHTSGIPWSTLSKIPETNTKDALERTVKNVVGQSLAHPPGTEFEYATINYDILALVAEKVTGEPFETFLQQHVIDALKLRHTTIGVPVAGDQMARGYKIGFFQPMVYDAPVFRGNNAAGYVISNAVDVGAWLKFQMGLGDSELYPLARLTHQRDETVPLHGMNSYARGWDVSLDGTGEIFHTGLNPNFSAYIAFRQKEGIGVAVLANANSGFTPFIGNKIMKSLAGEEIEKETDPDDGRDRFFSVASFVLVAYSLIVVALLVSIVIAAFKRHRHYEPMTLPKLGRFARALAIMLPFLYGIYLLPEMMAGFTWEAIVVWAPVSFAAMIIMILVSIGLSYVVYLVSLFFPERNSLRRHAPQILLMSIVSGLANMVVIIMVTSALDSDTALKYQVFYYTLVILVYLLGRRFVQTHLIRLTTGLIFELRIKLIDRIFSTSYQRFEKIDRERVYTALNDDVSTIGDFTNMFVMLATNIITAIGAFLYLASIALWAAVLVIAIVGVITTVYYFVSRSTNLYVEQARDSKNVFIGFLNGMIDGFKEISLHVNKKTEYKKDMADSADEYRSKIATADIRMLNAFLVGESLLLVLLGVVAFGIPELFPNIKSYAIMSFVIVLLYLIGPINGILGSVPTVLRLRVAWNRVQQFLKEIPANLNLRDMQKPVVPKLESIRASGVRFRYQSKADSKTFEVGPIDLEVRAGEILFIIGGNGSGKTTLAKLLTGLYEPDEGVVLINDKEVRGIQLSECFSTVFSPSYLFEKLYNIDVKGKQELMRKHLKLLNLEDKVEISENQYSTIKLSGGQRKRLALLQCYMEDSPIYLFDEWAADQDPDYRNFFYRTLLPEMKRMGKIVIAITHDDHYFDVADKVLVMKQGKLENYFTDFAFTRTGLG